MAVIAIIYIDIIRKKCNYMKSQTCFTKDTITNA